MSMLVTDVGEQNNDDKLVTAVTDFAILVTIIFYCFVCTVKPKNSYDFNDLKSVTNIQKKKSSTSYRSHQ